ncbi:MAG: GNAT family N-acetyltransferase [Roseobacter sp.]
MTDPRDPLFAALDATWPPAHVFSKGPWTLREGAGGGKRVSAATASRPVSDDEIVDAENQMAALGQSALFMITPQDDTLDAMLDARGYDIVDPVVILTIPIARLTDKPMPRLVAFEIWRPLAIMEEIWAAGGIGSARLNVMARADVKTAIFTRWDQKPAGVGFVAAQGSIAMVHAVEVLSHQRRKGVAQWIMRQAADWAARQGARTIAVLCVKSNAAALELYSNLGFEVETAYHYRQETNVGAISNGKN